MKSFQSLIVAALLVVVSFSKIAQAGALVPFEETAFEQAQAAGKTILLDFHADWCSTCKKQKPIIEGLLKEEGLSSVVSFTVDYDNAGALKKSLKVQKQSTLIVFKGKNEMARNMGLTGRDEIKALIVKGI